MKVLTCVLLTLFLSSLATAADATKGKVSFKNETEVGIVIVGGNTNTEVYNAKTLNDWTLSESAILTLGGSYLEGRKLNEVTDVMEVDAKQWDAILKFEKRLSDIWSSVFSQNIESDKFNGYAQRYNTDVGLKWRAIDDKDFYIHTEIGYRYTIENNVDDNKNDQGFEDGTRKDNKARLYYEMGGTVNTNIKGKFWVEYIPNFGETQDWLLNFEPSLSMILNNTFALKLAFEGRYDNQVNVDGNKKFDYTYTTNIVATF